MEGEKEEGREGGREGGEAEGGHTKGLVNAGAF